MKTIRTIMFVFFLTSNATSFAYEDIIVTDLTGDNINSRLKSVLGDQLKTNNDVFFPYEIVIGSVNFERYDQRFLEKVKVIFDQKVSDIVSSKRGKRLIPHPVSFNDWGVSGIFLKEADKVNIDAVVAKSVEAGLLVPFGLEGRYHSAAVEYSSNNCPVTLILNYTALRPSGSLLTFQIFAPKKVSACLPADEVKSEAHALANYFEGRLMQ